MSTSSVTSSGLVRALLIFGNNICVVGQRDDDVVATARLAVGVWTYLRGRQGALIVFSVGSIDVRTSALRSAVQHARSLPSIDEEAV